MARVIVVGNEKGGAGKSTLAIHLLAGLMQTGHSVAVMDLDLRQRSLAGFLANRRAWLEANRATAALPIEPDAFTDGARLARAPEDEQLARFEAAFAAAQDADFLIIDTPGGDTALSRAAHGRADQIVTPMNDSFVDFGLLGEIDPVTLNLKRPSIYAETIWNARKDKAVDNPQAGLGQIDWLVVTNRLAVFEARNRRRVDERLDLLAKRVGFRVGPGLRDRVIYRELYPFGLTVADLSEQIRPVEISLAHVAARQELRSLMQALGLDAAAAQIGPGDAADETEAQQAA
ncbi:MAG TPA: division plane positioning ATPase MipZ [Brevundimonas sp.]|jgi:chromosome partitioning protein|uniref:division plane positioning ATPase MipZ n=1 Tax=Brevundimonas sp. TaxID=1871086 RepID=UPI002C35B612|nr:division plane positioning ATPase MipZ [Brevundimonas sp.]HRH20867.1 division plane positioning ATPase MipZ [Brevundimonas sp.]